MKKNITFTIVTPCFNSEKTIKNTLESVLNQTYQNYEYIIIDGKSSDNTLKIIDQYKEKFKGKLKVVSEKDNGIYDAMNKGIKMAKGDIVGIINSDDSYEYDALENIANNVTNEKYQILYGMLRMIENGIETSVVMKKHENLHNSMIQHPTCFVTKKTYEDFGMFDTKYKSCADYDFMIRMNKIEKVHFIPVYKIIAKFSADDGMSTKYKSVVETLKFKKNHSLISNKKYILLRMKIFVKKVLK